LGRLLYAKHGALFPSLESARDAVRTRRGAHGEAARDDGLTKFPWEKGKAGTVSLPPSLAENAEKVHLEPGRIAVLCDLHLPYHDTRALKVALRHLVEYKPNTILLGGDLIDFYAISRFITNPDVRNLPGELAATEQFLAYLRERFPRANIVYKLGNHDERWRHYIWTKAPELFGVAFLKLENVLNCEKYNVRMVDDRLSICMGGLTFLHGHELEQGAASPVNPARGVFLRTLDSYVIGHRHRSSDHTEKTANGRFITCWSIGCLCDMTPEYARINKWNHGFATVDLKASGEFRLTNHRIHDGRLF
jgi:metallophosphoesterase superfamily enzyme